MGGKSGGTTTSGGPRKSGVLVFGTIAALCTAVMVWILWPARPGQAGDTGGTTMVPKVLCSACGFIADADKVDLSGEAARIPAMGPGYKCLKCGQRTLYPNPYICKQCKTPFFMSREASGEYVSKCPKCGTVN